MEIVMKRVFTIKTISFDVSNFHWINLSHVSETRLGLFQYLDSSQKLSQIFGSSKIIQCEMNGMDQN